VIVARTKALVVAPTLSRAKALEKELLFLRREALACTLDSTPEDLTPYRLLVWEIEAKKYLVEPFLARFRPDTHAILVLPELDVKWAAFYLQDPRVNHLLRKPLDPRDLHIVLEKLDTGAIFGLEPFLPAQAGLRYRRITTYKDRCDALEELDEFAKRQRLRAQTRRSALSVTEEFLMNAMYQAPIDEVGTRLFRDVNPKARLHRKTPRPVSFRFTIHEKSLFLSVRDRYGSFSRSDLARYLLRCASSEVQIEEKTLGAGLGLYLITSLATKFVINILPGRVSEFVCALEPPTGAATGLRLLSVTTGRSAMEEKVEPPAFVGE
jgi:hypothetical protein